MLHCGTKQPLRCSNPAQALSEYILNMKLEDLDPRTVAALKRAGIGNLSQLKATSDKELGMLPGIGKKSLESIRQVVGAAEADLVNDQIDKTLKSIRASRTSISWAEPDAISETIQRAQETVSRSAELIEEARRRRGEMSEARVKARVKN
jgi:NAD-dependent DNA ligase